VGRERNVDTRKATTKKQLLVEALARGTNE